MNELKDFFDKERSRVFTPGPFFTERVMARLRSLQARPVGILDIVPGSARPVFALALLLIVCFFAIELLIPQTPQRGMIESYLEPEKNPAESFLYSEADVPSHQEVLQQVINLEETK